MEPKEQQRTGSAVPCSCHQVESSIMPLPVDRAWGHFKTFKLEKLLPGKITATNFTSGGPLQIDSIVKIDYADGAHWEIRINELSNIRYSLGYEVINTEPAHLATSIQGQIILRPVTDDNTTYVEWITEFSNDADISVISDQKYKKLEFFQEMKKTITSEKL